MRVKGAAPTVLSDGRRGAGGRTPVSTSYGNAVAKAELPHLLCEYLDSTLTAVLHCSAKAQL